MSLDNPFAVSSALPYGLPDFSALAPHHYLEGFEVGMADQLRLLDAMKVSAEPPTVENTLGAWEDARRLLAQVKQAFYAVKAADSSPEMDAIAEEVAPRLARHNDAIYLDAELYARFVGLRRRADAGEVTLDAQDDWHLAELTRSFIRSGVALDAVDQVRLRELNARLATLASRFERASRDARNAGAITFTDDDLAAMPDEARTVLAATGNRVELVNTSRQPVLATLCDRSARERIYRASTSRALAGEYDTRQLVVDIARARAERAGLLGYPHHAALVAEQGCVKSTELVNDVMGRLARAALAKAEDEAAALRDHFATLEPDAEFAPWDWEYAAASLRAASFDLSADELAPYLAPERVRQAVFDAATELYGVRFTARPELRGHTVDAEVFSVDDADGAPVGLFVHDLWARPTKDGGAWMNSLVLQSQRYAELPVVTNNCNYRRDPAAISWDGAITMFHEFGHALHGLFSQVRYPSRSGTAVPRDFVEFPSQVNEHWAWQPDRVLPAHLLDKLRAASSFGIGYAMIELLMATLLDQAWHQASLDELPSSGDEVEAFERAALERWGVASELIPPRYRSQYFSHIWSGGYAAGYYGYTWSEMMDADAVAWFDEVGGTRGSGDYFRETLLAPGGSVDPSETYRAFRGRDPEIAPLLTRLGMRL